MKRGTFEDIRTFSKKFHHAEKNSKGGPFGIFQHRFCRMRWKKEQLFWLRTLGQMAQFDTLEFCGTFKNYFDQFASIEKKSQL